MAETLLQANQTHTFQRHKSFKDKIQDYQGVVKGQIERTKSLFVDKRQEEEAKKANLLSTQKLIEFRQKSRDYRLAIDHLAAEYTLAKETSCLVRYGKMKLMVKRILMQDSELSKMNLHESATLDTIGDRTSVQSGKPPIGTMNSIPTTSNGGASTPSEFVIPPGVNRQHKDIVAKLQKMETMSRLEILEDTKKLDEELADLGSRLSQVHSAVQRLEEDYTDAKRFAPWDRYMMMKKMIKQFVTCKNALTN